MASPNQGAEQHPLIDGLELHHDVIDGKLQSECLKKIDTWLAGGRRGDKGIAELKGSTYSPVPPNFKHRNQSREMLQFGVYTHSNRVDLYAKVAPMPHVLLKVIDKLTEKGLIPKVGNLQEWCCTVNSYEKGQWIPPHIDNRKFSRPFVTLSLLSEQDIVFSPLKKVVPNDDTNDHSNSEVGASMTDTEPETSANMEQDSEVVATNISPLQDTSVEKDEYGTGNGLCYNESLHAIDDPVEIREKMMADEGAVFYSLPVGSLLVMNGDSGNSYTHAVPPVSERRVSLTFRRLIPEVEVIAAGVRNEAVLNDLAKVTAKREKKAKEREEKAMRKKANKEQLQREKEAATATTARSSDGSNKRENDSGKSIPVPLQLLNEVKLDDGEMNELYATTRTGDSASSTEVVTDESELLHREALIRSKVVKMPMLERVHVQNLYDAIAPNWHGTRYKAWPKVEAFIQSCPPFALICDAGCGNGKNLPACCYTSNKVKPSELLSSEETNKVSVGVDDAVVGSKRGYGIGSDFSKELISICNSRGLEALVADSLSLPYRSNSFDACLSIAVLHHISTVQRRKMLIAEGLRVIKIGGRALFYAWAKDQTGGHSKHEFAAPDVLVPFHSRINPPQTSSKLTKQQTSSSGNNSTGKAGGDGGANNADHDGCSDEEPTNRLKRQKAEEEPELENTGGNGDDGDDAGTPMKVIMDASTGQEIKHAAINESKKSIVYQRYCHVFSGGELTEIVNSLNHSYHSSSSDQSSNKGERESLLEKKWCEVEIEYYDTGNWCIIVKKLDEMPSRLFT